MNYQALKNFFASKHHDHPLLATSDEVDGKIASQPPHDHAALYYTKSEVDTIVGAVQESKLLAAKITTSDGSVNVPSAATPYYTGFWLNWTKAAGIDNIIVVESSALLNRGSGSNELGGGLWAKVIINSVETWRFPVSTFGPVSGENIFSTSGVAYHLNGGSGSYRLELWFNAWADNTGQALFWSVASLDWLYRLTAYVYELKAF